MGVLTIRKLDDHVLARIKQQAKAAGRSMEEEARRALADAFGATSTPEEWIAELRETQRRLFADRLFPDDLATDTIREFRDEGRGGRDETGK